MSDIELKETAALQFLLHMRQSITRCQRTAEDLLSMFAEDSDLRLMLGVVMAELDTAKEGIENIAKEVSR